MVGAILACVAVLYTFCCVCYTDIATYYIYMEACGEGFCYAVRGINVSYNIENQDVYLLCTTPMPLDEEETLPRAVVKGSTTYESNELTFVSTAKQPCNDTNPLLLEHVSGESHVVRVSIFYHDFDLDDTGKYLNHRESFLSNIIINFQANGTVNIIGNGDPEPTNLTFNETSSLCSTYEDVENRACFCKENHAREFCLEHTCKKLDILRKGDEYYHIYGTLIVNTLRYYYYFEIYVEKYYTYDLFLQRNTAALLREAGGNESMSLCVSYNGSVADVEHRWKWICIDRKIYIPKAKQNFTVFAKLYDNKWHSLMWFDFLRWPKSYIPGNCSYEEQVLDGVVRPFAICMRRNVTEKFYKNITQVDQTSSTLWITTDYSESAKEASQSTVQSTLNTILLNQDDIDVLPGIAEKRNTEDGTFQRFFNPYVITCSVSRKITETLPLISAFFNCYSTYYVYMEECKDKFCYAVREINISYNTESQDVSLLCTTPMPLDEEETLPRAEVKGSNAHESEPNIFVTADDQPCNDSTPLLLELVSGESHIVSITIFYQEIEAIVSTDFTTQSQLKSMLVDLQPNGSVNIMVLTFDKVQSMLTWEKTELTFSETSSHCSIYEDDSIRTCFCKENFAKECCLHRDYLQFDPIRNGSQFYHIYGRLTMDSIHYYYYFEMSHHQSWSYTLYVQRYSAFALREAGSNEPMSLCVSYNGSATDAEYNSRIFCYSSSIIIPITTHSNFTAFAKFHDNEWHSLMWFDYLRWSKSYIAGNCSYEEQGLDGVVRPFAICMRRNVTEKFYNNIIQGGQTSSTLWIITDHSEPETEKSQATTSQISRKVMEPDSLLNQNDIEESLSRIAEMRNISGEIVNEVLSILDTFLNSTQHSLQLDSSRILQSLNSIIRNSCCDINFIGDWSLVIRRHAVSCLETDPNKWPTMNEIPKKSYFGYDESRKNNYAAIEIPYETVCNDRKNNEYIVIYYLFSNQMLFAEKEKKEPENACELRKRTQQNFPILSAQLIDKLSMETIHQINVHKEYKLMAKIVFPLQLSAKLHGSTKLVYWHSEKWTDAKNSIMNIENGHYVYKTNHLTDFTLVVDGLEMDPILCDAALDSISVMINFLSFVGLLILIACLTIKRYLPGDTFKKECSMGHSLQKLPSKYENTRLNYFVVLALFHLGFLLLSDSRNLFWPISCANAAMVLYWLLLTCILITTFQSLHILKILASNSQFENLLIYVVSRKLVLFVTLGVPTVIVLILKAAFPLFFDRQDYLTSSTKSDGSLASVISNGARYVEKAFTLLCIQLMLGIPWICQYLTLFAPQLTTAHYIFTIVIGSQGLIFFMLFCYRKIKKRYS